MSDNRTRLYGLALLPSLTWRRKPGYIVVWESPTGEDIPLGDVYHDWWDDDLLHGNMDGKWYCDGMKLEHLSLGTLVKDMRSLALASGKIPSPVRTGPDTISKDYYDHLQETVGEA